MSEMNLQRTEQMLQRIFPQQLDYIIEGHIITGYAQVDGVGQVRLLGTVNAAAMNHEIALRLSKEILQLIQHQPQQAVAFIVDTQGQDLSRADELLCLNRSFAHLASCVELLRQHGHANLAMIFGQAVSGGFLSYGLMANEVYAFDDSQVKVMDLNAMARVTKIPVECLQNLSQTSAIFAPGVENYYKMGAIVDIWHLDEADKKIAQALQNQHKQNQNQNLSQDQRRVIAEQRQGRMLCNQIVKRVLAD